MSLPFNPLIWFVCRLCRQTFPDMEILKNHKVQEHQKECEKIKCIIFEERLLNDQWASASNICSQQSIMQEENEMFTDNIYCHCDCTASVSLSYSKQRSMNSDDDLVPPTKKLKQCEENVLQNSSELSTDNLTDEVPETVNAEPSVEWEDAVIIKMEPDINNYEQIDNEHAEIVTDDGSNEDNVTYAPSDDDEILFESNLEKLESQPSPKSLVKNTPKKRINPKRFQTTSELYHWLINERQILLADGTRKVILIDPEPNLDEPQEITKDNPISCLLCSDILITMRSVQLHVNDCWTINKARHVYCMPCKKSFEKPVQLKVHQIKEHPEEKNKALLKTTSFKCKLCTLTFSEEHLYDIHIELHKDPNFKPFQCPHCTWSFQTKWKLTNHLIVHGIATKYKCRFCQKCLRSADYLEAHERSHTGERPYKCPVATCTKAFASVHCLKIHKKNMHVEELGLEKFPCTVCGQIFGMKSKLDWHVRIKHNGEKAFKCQQEGCSNAYPKLEYLKKHMKSVHSEEKPFQCDECDAAYKFLTDLKKHKLYHAKQKEFLCHLCSKNYYHNWELKKHLRDGHNGAESEGEMDSTPASASIPNTKSKSKTRSKYECDLCAFECNTKVNLNKHKKLHNEDEDSASEYKG